MTSRILYLDEHFLVINKLPGEAAEGAGPGMIDLSARLTEAYGIQKQGRAFPVTALHRLDVPVSGCLLWARSRRAQSLGASLFSQGAVEKVYWAVVAGDGPNPPTGELVH